MVAPLREKNGIVVIIIITTSLAYSVCFVLCKEHSSYLTFSFNESICKENFALQLLYFGNETDILSRRQDEVLCRWKKNFEMIKHETLKAVLKLSPRGEEGIAGGTFVLPNGTLLYLEGSGNQMMFDLKDSLNLTVEYTFSNDWNGAWYAVEYGLIDLGVPLRTIQFSLAAEGALKKVALLHPIVAMTSNVYFRPPPLAPSHYLLFWPLRLQTWLVFLGVWIICIFVCCVTHSIYMYPLSHTRTRLYHRFLMSEVLLWGVTILSGKDYPVPRKGPLGVKMATSLRIALLSVMFLSIIILAVYTAKIMAIFSISSEIIKSPEDLIKYKYTLSSYSFVHMERIFKNLVHKPEAIIQAVKLFSSLGGRVSSMKRLLGVGNPDPRFAFLTHPDGFFVRSSARRPFQNHTIELCSVSVFTSTIKSPRSMYIKKNSKFRDILNWKILQLCETGINYRHQKAFGKHFEYTCFNSKGPYQELNIQQTSSLFWLLIIGVSLAIFIQLWECFYYHVLGSLKKCLQSQSRC